VSAAKRPRDWTVGQSLVLHANDPEIPGQYVTIHQYGRRYDVAHWLGMNTLIKQESKDSLTKAIRLAESWVR
jgi:hypothetical protein